VTTTRLHAIEAAYLEAERDEAPLHVASVGYFEAAPFFVDGVFRIDDIRARIAARLGAMPRLRQRIVEVPLGVGRPVWADDEAFDIAHHIDVVHVPSPGDEHAVVELLTDYYMRPLDRQHPLWHLLFVTGAADGRVVLFERIHHALADGVGGVGLATVLLDLAREPQPDSSYPTLPDPEATPNAVSLVADAVRERALEPLRLVREGLHSITADPLHALESVKSLASATTSATNEKWRAPKSDINAAISGERRIVFVRGSLDEYKAIGAAHDATVNDVVLAVVTAGLRALLLGRNEFLASEATLKTLVPVSMRDAADATALGNQVGGLLANLPVGIGDPLLRLVAVADTTQRLKDAHEDAGSALLVAAADLLPPPALRLMHVAMLHQPFVNLVTTNVPGPPFPLYAMGAELLEAFPLVPIYGNLAIGVAVLSYNGALNFGITYDPKACPDADVFVDGLRHEIEVLSAV
jgi:WS/DGAT/MGAT family acyltransferase